MNSREIAHVDELRNVTYAAKTKRQFSVEVASHAVDDLEVDSVQLLPTCGSPLARGFTDKTKLLSQLGGPICL